MNRLMVERSDSRSPGWASGATSQRAEPECQASPAPAPSAAAPRPAVTGAEGPAAGPRAPPAAVNAAARRTACRTRPPNSRAAAPPAAAAGAAQGATSTRGHSIVQWGWCGREGTDAGSRGRGPRLKFNLLSRPPRVRGSAGGRLAILLAPAQCPAACAICPCLRPLRLCVAHSRPAPCPTSAPRWLAAASISPLAAPLLAHRVAPVVRDAGSLRGGGRRDRGLLRDRRRRRRRVVVVVAAAGRDRHNRLDDVAPSGQGGIGQDRQANLPAVHRDPWMRHVSKLWQGRALPPAAGRLNRAGVRACGDQQPRRPWFDR
eukprot:COSAG06_NODE_5638_length_3346_cov_2.856483_2_plen_317_part_00